MALAIFDLDHTLLNGDSDHAWGQYLVDRKLVAAEEHQRRNDEFYQQYQAGTLDIHAYLAFALEPLTRYPRTVMEAEREQFLQQRILPMISAKSRELIAEHQQRGDRLLIITATNGFVTYPIAEMLGIADIIAPQPELAGNDYTGRIVGIPSFQQGKVTRLQQWLEQHQLTLEGSYFYSDSHNDLPLLREVEHPVAVDPDPTLLQVAQQQGWKIISLRD